jgi:hypothetical protein
MYSKDEISTLFKSVVNPALEEFGAELKERGWKIEDIQIHDPAYRWIGNTLTSKIQATKKTELCFSYKILAEPFSKSTPGSYILKFQYGCHKDTVGLRDFPDNYNPNINTLTKDELIEHIKKRYDEL